MTKSEKADCRKIADHYGWKVEKAKLIEEMGELKKAIEDWDALRDKYGKHSLTWWEDDEDVNKKCIEVANHIWEEVADVEICLHHAKFLNCAKKIVAEYRKQKIARQLERMEAGE